MITKQVAHYLAQRIKESSKYNVKGWILFYPFSINFEPLSHNYIFITDKEYKKQRLSVDYIEVLELDLQDLSKQTIKVIESFILLSIISYHTLHKEV